MPAHKESVKISEGDFTIINEPRSVANPGAINEFGYSSFVLLNNNGISALRIDHIDKPDQESYLGIEVLTQVSTETFYEHVESLLAKLDKKPDPPTQVDLSWKVLDPSNHRHSDLRAQRPVTESLLIVREKIPGELPFVRLESPYGAFIHVKARGEGNEGLYKAGLVTALKAPDEFTDFIMGLTTRLLPRKLILDEFSKPPFKR